MPDMYYEIISSEYKTLYSVFECGFCIPVPVVIPNVLTKEIYLPSADSIEGIKKLRNNHENIRHTP